VDDKVVQHKQSLLSLPVGLSSFFQDDTVPVMLKQNPQKGRYLVAKRLIKRGEVVLAADCYARVSSEVPDLGIGEDSNSQWQEAQQRLSQLEMANDGDVDAADMVLNTTNDASSEFLFDREAMQLAVAVVCRQCMETNLLQCMTTSELKRKLGAAGVDYKDCREKHELVSKIQAMRGVHRLLTFGDVEDLDSHSDMLTRVGPRARTGIHTSVRLLKQALGWHAGGTLTDDALMHLLLCIKYNAHPVMDEFHSHKVGIGLYPAACYLNTRASPIPATITSRRDERLYFGL